jgi:hypothetical protein
MDHHSNLNVIAMSESGGARASAEPVRCYMSTSLLDIIRFAAILAINLSNMLTYMALTLYMTLHRSISLQAITATGNF